MCTAYFSTPFISLKLKGKAKWAEEMREGGEDHDITGGFFFLHWMYFVYWANDTANPNG